MSTQKPIPLVVDTAEGDISGQELLVNVFPSKSNGGKYPYTLTNAPGLAFIMDLPTGPIKSMISVNDRGFAATATEFYEIFISGVYVKLGDIDQTGIISMAQNGYQIVMVNGIKGYSYDLATNIVSEITDVAFYPAKTVTFQDGYFIFERTGTGQFFLSGLLAVTFNPLDFATAEGQPDNLVAALSDHRELFLFGTSSIEVWYNSGSADFPFERNQGVFIEKGCAARYSIAKQNNTVYFVGSDLMVYQINGYTPMRISTHAIEDDLKGVNLDDATAYTYSEQGHLFYCLTIPERKITWSYDISMGTWHQRKCKEFGRNRVNCLMVFAGRNIVGDFQSGRIYELTTDYLKDDQDQIIREFILPTINMGREQLSINSFELDMSSGVGLQNGQGETPLAGLTTSKDGGKTWGSTQWVQIGKIGEYLTRVKWNRLGNARQFILKVTISDPIPINIGGAWIEVS